MSLVSPDAQGIGRYEEATAITSFSALLNLALAAVSARFAKDVYGRKTFAGVTASAGGLADLGGVDPNVTFASKSHERFVDLEVVAVVDLSASPPSARNVILTFATTAGTIVNDIVTVIDWPSGAASAGSTRTISQRARLTLPAGVGADVKLQWTPSANNVRIGASAWHFHERPY